MPSATSEVRSTIPRKDKARLLEYLSNEENFNSIPKMNDGKPKCFGLRIFLPLILLCIINFSKGGIQIQLYLGVVWSTPWRTRPGWSMLTKPPIRLPELWLQIASQMVFKLPMILGTNTKIIANMSKVLHLHYHKHNEEIQTQP